MQIATITTWLNPVGWMGPIFDKELRVASRRKRTYWLRTGYVGMMAVFLIPVWAEQLRYSGGSGLATLAVSEIGIQISRILLMIQFISMQILSAFFLCTSIREEITRRTLGVLWTTPISGFQLVIGKLTSKMLILIQLLAMSIPILSMLRLFGGIPWQMLIAGLCLTLATMFLIGSLSQLLSLYFRNGFMVVAMVAISLAVAWGLFPILVFFGWALWNNHIMMPRWLEFLVMSVNPYFAFIDQLAAFSTRPSPIVCCLVQLAIGLLLVWFSAVSVRKRGLYSISEQNRQDDFNPAKYDRRVVFLFRPWFAHTLIKRWLGPGMIWKESVSPLFRSRHRMLLMILTAIGIGVGLWILIVMTVFDMWKIVNIQTQMGIVLLGFVLAVLLTLIAAVTVITSEIEGQSWPILLTTPLTNLHILTGKIFGVLRRSGWSWAALLGWGLISCWQKTLKSEDVIKWVPVFLVTIWFLMSVGFYLAVQNKRAIPAIVLGLVVLLILWVILPLTMNYFEGLSFEWNYQIHQGGFWFMGFVAWLFDLIHFNICYEWFCEIVQCSNPLFFLLLLTLGEEVELYYDCYESNHLMTYFLLMVILYSFLGILFCTRARKTMRQRVFE